MFSSSVHKQQQEVTLSDGANKNQQQQHTKNIFYRFHVLIDFFTQ